MTHRDPIHSEHCRCARCNPRQPLQPYSPTLAAAALAIVAGIVLLVCAWLGSQLHELLLTPLNF